MMSRLCTLNPDTTLNSIWDLLVDMTNRNAAKKRDGRHKGGHPIDMITRKWKKEQYLGHICSDLSDDEDMMRQRHHHSHIDDIVLIVADRIICSI